MGINDNTVDLDAFLNDELLNDEYDPPTLLAASDSNHDAGGSSHGGIDF